MMKINGRNYPVPDGYQDLPLVHFLRDHLGLMGTKFGCGKGLCGSCTCHLNGEAARACQISCGEIGDRQVTTIEGLSTDGRARDGLHPLQQAWIAENVPQCGYCQPGQIMSAAALLQTIKKPSDEEIIAAMEGNLCRCGTYGRIRKAIHRVAGEMSNG